MREVQSCSIARWVDHVFRLQAMMGGYCRKEVELQGVDLVLRTADKARWREMVNCARLRLKCDGTRAETRFRLSAKRTSPFKLAGGTQFS